MKFFSRKTRRGVALKLRTAKPRFDLLEDRLTPSGFGPTDGAYIVESWSGQYRDVKIQPGDQKIVATGTMHPNPGTTFQGFETESRMAIARYDSMGNADVAYGSGGVSAPALGPVYQESGADLVLQADGKAVVSTAIYGAGGTRTFFHGAARFNTNGTLDSGFGSGGWTSVDVREDVFGAADGVGLQSTGSVVVAGFSMGTQGPAYSSAVVTRFTANGAVDSGKGGFGQVVHGKATGYTLSTFGAQSNHFWGLAIQPDDKVVTAGYISDNGANIRLIVARYTASGTLDKTFNGNGYSVLLPAGISYMRAYDVALQSNGKIVVAGTSAGVDGADDMLVVRYNANGTVDTSFGGGSGYVRLDVDGTASVTSEYANAVAIQPDGKIVLAGSLGVTGSPGSVLVYRLNANGTPDATFGASGFKLGTPPAGPDYHSFGGTGLALQSDGSIIIAGIDNWSATTNDPHPLLMRFFGGSSLLAAGGAARAASDTKPLTLAHVQPLLTEAIARWQTAGVDVSALQGVDIRIADLGGSTLGLAAGNTIWLDDDAAGYGWFVDTTPGDDSEFSTRGNQGEQGRMDLLSALMHEAGHVLGFEHEEAGAMQETLATSERHVPTSHSEELLTPWATGFGSKKDRSTYWDWLTAIDTATIV